MSKRTHRKDDTQRRWRRATALPEGLCDCLCLFDLEYAVVDLAPGTYTISVDGLYVPDGDPPLSADRSDYPWFLP